jgi:UDP-N-acetylmuramyl tripeptide synthase
MAPEAIATLGRRLTGGTTIVSATNGKTTTAGMIAAALAAVGRHPVHNRAGSNMSWGVATALLEQHGDEGLFEVDEAWLPRIAADLSPRVVTLSNLFRDQLDRYGELERLADDWAALVAECAGRTGFVLNADDPLVADLGRDRELARRPGVTYFGVEDHSQALPELQHAFDAKHCRRCGHPYSYERAFVGHLGHYSCPNCHADRPAPDLAATAIELDGMSGSRFVVRDADGAQHRVRLPLPGVYNVYNALAALATAVRLDVPIERAIPGLESVEAAFGRVETIEVAGVEVAILLIKNPAGTNEVLRTLRLESGNGAGPRPGLHLWLALNDRIADGRDVSWIWDADFELLSGIVDRVHCSGTRAPEIAARLKYAGIEPASLVVEASIERSLDAAVADADARLFALPTYTALIELRRLLASRGLAREFWR